jgi:hypothetical protein
VHNLIQLYKSLWDDRNYFVHDHSCQDSKWKLCERVISIIESIYKSPSKLHSRFQKIHSIPLATQISRSTNSMQQWIAKITHQSKVSESLFAPENAKQLTLHQTMVKIQKNHCDQHKYSHDMNFSSLSCFVTSDSTSYNTLNEGEAV